MSPRPYRLGLRQAATDETRARILAAARESIMASASFAGFTVDAVARRAGVARMTVYYQFGSKAGLVEALFDAIARGGGMERLPEVFQQADASAALREFIAVFVRFWASDRLVFRRVHALAALDPELGSVLRAREEGRRQGLRVIAGRLIARPNGGGVTFDEAIDLLYSLTSFETFDSLAGESRDADGVAAMLHAVARATLGTFSADGAGGSR